MTSKNVTKEDSSSEDGSDEDEEIDLERDDQGQYIIFKPNENDEEEELSEKFMALKSNKQI